MSLRSSMWVPRDVGRPDGGSVVLVLLGAVLLGASLFQGDGNAPYALGLLIFGSGLVVLGVVLPRLRTPRWARPPASS